MTPTRHRILEVNEELGHAVVEPGVRFLDPYAHLKANGHRLAMSVPDIGWPTEPARAADTAQP